MNWSVKAFIVITILALGTEFFYRYRFEFMLSLFESENILVQKVLVMLAVSARVPDIPRLRVNFAALSSSIVPTLNATMPVEEDVRAIEKIQRPARDGRGWFKLLMFTPPNPNNEKLPTLLHIHGGWWVLGLSEQQLAHAFGRQICAYLLRGGIAANVVELDYRLAPEHPFPAALHDVLDAIAYLRQHADALNVDVSRLVVGGESVGGNLALAAALADAEAGERRIASVAAIIPVADISPGWNETAWYEEWVDHGFSHEMNNLCTAAYCPATKCDRSNPLVSPLRASDALLRALPPVVIKTHGRDCLAGAAEMLADRMSALGLRIERQRCAACMHITQSRDRFAPFETAIVAVSKARSG